MIRKTLAGLLALCVALGALAQVTTNPVVTNTCPPLGASVTHTNRGPGECEQQRFFVALQTSLVPGIALGDATHTFTRATVGDQIDFEGLHHQVLSGEARFQGARRVRNRLNETFVAGWSLEGTASFVANNATAPDGSLTAGTLTAATDVTYGTGNNLYCSPGVSATPAGQTRFTVWVKAGTATTFKLSLRDNGTGTQTTTAALAAPAVWTRYSTIATAGAATTDFAHIIGAADGTLLIWHPQSENVTGQTNQNPSEYVSVGVLAAPYHGAGVDGVKYFDTLNGNTVSSNVVTEATGAHIDSSQAAAAGGVAAGVVDAVGPRGYLAEGAATNLALQSNNYSATWTNATVTPVQNAVGIDGATSAWTTTQTGADGTDSRSQQNITVANDGATYTASIFIAKTGAPTTYPSLALALTGGTGVTSQAVLNTQTGTIATSGTASVKDVGNFWRVSATVTNNTSGNTTLSVKYYPAYNNTGTTGFGTKQNGVAVSTAVQTELGSIATSYIPTTTVAVARNADVLTYQSAGNINAVQGASYAEVGTIATAAYATTITALSTFTGATGGVPLDIAYNAGYFVNLYDGTANRNGIAFTPSIAPQKIASSWGGSTANTYANGVAGTNLTFDGDLSLNDNLGIGVHAGGTQPLNGTIRNVRIWGNALSSGRLQALTQ